MRPYLRYMRAIPAALAATLIVVYITARLPQGRQHIDKGPAKPVRLLFEPQPARHSSQHRADFWRNDDVIRRQPPECICHLPYRRPQTSAFNLRQHSGSVGPIYADGAPLEASVYTLRSGFLWDGLWQPDTIKVSYPKKAATLEIEGRVTVRLDIDGRGSIVDVSIVSSSPEGVFDNAVLSALKKTKVSPRYIVDLGPVAHTRHVTFDFRLN